MYSPENDPQLEKWIVSNYFIADTDYVSVQTTQVNPKKTHFPDYDLVSYPIAKMKKNPLLLQKILSFVQKNFVHIYCQKRLPPTKWKK